MKKKILYYQCDVSQNGKKMKTWLPDLNIKEGYSVTLEGEQGWWQIDEIYNFAITGEDLTTLDKKYRLSFPSIKHMKQGKKK